jgi:hypothetical protein
MNAEVELIDGLGNTVKKTRITLMSGTNQLVLPNTSSLPVGIYTLRAHAEGDIILRRVMKQN